MEKIFVLWCALRRHPTDRSTLERFFAAIEPRLRWWARRWRDPDEVAQQASCRIWAKWDRCQASTQRQLAAWMRQIVRRCGLDLCAGVSPEEIEPAELPAPGADPEESLGHRERGEMLEQVISGTLGIEPAGLPMRHRAWAREHKVAATPKGIQRDVQILVALRLDEESIEEVARRFGISPAAARQAAVRGEAALLLWARVNRWTQ